MEELLPHYERELGFLRRYSREFAERYPKIAGALLIAGEVCDDPHVERLIQSFALLNARVSKRLDDDYPEFTEALLSVLYPHYLRPFPACSVVRMHYAATASQLTNGQHVPRGTTLLTRPVNGLSCTFKTAYEVVISPVQLSNARFDPIIDAPESVSLPTAASSKITLTFEALGAGGAQALKGLRTLRVFLDGEPSFCAGLRDVLLTRAVKAYAEVAGRGKWIALDQLPVAEVGFADEDALIDFPARSHPAYRLLTEYFAFPEKFNFIDIDLAAITALLPAGVGRINLHLVLAGIRADSNTARMLGSLGAANLLLGCTPVINLFQKSGVPIKMTHTSAEYTVLGDLGKPYAFEVYSIDSVQLLRQTTQGDSVEEFYPFYSLCHGQTPEIDGHYWAMRRDQLIAEKSPGHEVEISIVDIDFDPAGMEGQTLSLELSCTNRDLPASLSYGLPGGDLFLLGAAVSSISFLRKPSAPLRFEGGRGAHWRLISHLALNHLSLSQGGLPAFREMLSLYDQARSPTSQRQIGAIAAIEHRAANAWLPGNPFASLVRGIEVRLTVDEEGFVGSGLHGFVSVLDRFLGLYVHANSFTQLVIISKKTGEELRRCLPRSGDLTLA